MAENIRISIRNHEIVDNEKLKDMLLCIPAYVRKCLHGRLFVPPVECRDHYLSVSHMAGEAGQLQSMPEKSGAVSLGGQGCEEKRVQCCDIS